LRHKLVFQVVSSAKNAWELRGHELAVEVDYLQRVRDRPSPAARGETFAMRVVSLELHGAIAHAVVRCPMLGFDYVNFLSLVRAGEKWAIGSKVFTHLTAAT